VGFTASMYCRSSAGKPAPPATAKSRPRLWGKGYGDFSVAFFTIGRNSTSMWSAVPIANLNFISPALPF